MTQGTDNLIMVLGDQLDPASEAFADFENGGGGFADILKKDVHRRRPLKLVVVKPRDYRVLHILRQTAHALNVSLDVRPDRGFNRSSDEFRSYSNRH